MSDAVMSSLGAAVVGTGSGVVNHVRAMQGAGIKVRSLVGRNPDRTAKRAAVFGIEHSTTELVRALARDDVQIVAVATPPNTHAELVLRAVAAGKHVMCEKPFARDATEAADMLRAAEEAGVVHLLGTEFRFAQGQGLLTRTVRSGVIGEPTFVLSVLHMPTLSYPAAVMPEWWDDVEQGGGWLGAHSTHVFDQIRTMGAEITSVSATLTSISRRPMTADDTYTVQFTTASGGGGVAHGSCAAAGPFFAAMKITGTDGSAWLQGEDVWLDTGNGAVQLLPADDLPRMLPAPAPAELIETTYDAMRSSGVNLGPFVRLYEVMRDRVLGIETTIDPPAATFVDGAANQLVMDAVRTSARERSWVDVAGLPPPPRADAACQPRGVVE